MYIADGKTNGPAFSWPDGKRIAVMVTFDYDAEFLRISRAKSKGTSIGFTDFSRGQYGPHEGLARCLDMLDTMNIKSTFFVPGAVIETYRDTVEEIHRRGHELACHGYRHESDPELSRDEMIKILDKSEALLAEITGKKPVLKLHPQMIGRASRIGMVGEFIAYMQNHGAWITTCEDVARYVQKQNGGNRA